MQTIVLFKVGGEYKHTKVHKGSFFPNLALGFVSMTKGIVCLQNKILFKGCGVFFVFVAFVYEEQKVRGAV